MTGTRGQMSAHREAERQTTGLTMIHYWQITRERHAGGNGKKRRKEVRSPRPENTDGVKGKRGLRRYTRGAALLLLLPRTACNRPCYVIGVPMTSAMSITTNPTVWSIQHCCNRFRLLGLSRLLGPKKTTCPSTAVLSTSFAKKYLSQPATNNRESK